MGVEIRLPGFQMNKFKAELSGTIESSSSIMMDDIDELKKKDFNGGMFFPCLWQPDLSSYFSI